MPHPNQNLTLNTCLVFITRQPLAGDWQVLLLYKNRGANAGLWVPPGGKVQQTETPLMAARSEMKEETGFSSTALRPMGLVSQWEPPQHWSLHLFHVHAFSGQEKAGDEGDLAWVSEHDLDSHDLPVLDQQLWPHWWRAIKNNLWLDVLALHDQSGGLEDLKVENLPG